jgi:hypothetical protein
MNVIGVRITDVFQTFGSANSASQDQQLIASLEAGFFERASHRSESIDDKTQRESSRGTTAMPERKQKR